MDQEAIIQRELQYIGSRSQKPSSWITALDLMANGKVNTEALVTRTVGLDEFKEGITALMNGKK